MAKSKYAKRIEDAVAFECTKRKCKWQGLEDDRVQKRTDPIYMMYESCCPNCGNNEFYMLLEKPK